MLQLLECKSKTESLLKRQKTNQLPITKYLHIQLTILYISRYIHMCATAGPTNPFNPRVANVLCCVRLIMENDHDREHFLSLSALAFAFAFALCGQSVFLFSTFKVQTTYLRLETRT